jgi:hypothetical protein
MKTQLRRWEEVFAEDEVTNDQGRGSCSKSGRNPNPTRLEVNNDGAPLLTLGIETNIAKPVCSRMTDLPPSDRYYFSDVLGGCSRQFNALVLTAEVAGCSYSWTVSCLCTDMADSEARALAVIHEGRGIGWITLGQSLHAILTRMKAQTKAYPKLDLSYFASDPVAQPIVLNLPENGFRLRFDGPDQRLRLIEVLDFSKITLTYHATELVRRGKSSSEGSFEPDTAPHGPRFNHVYRLFGPTYPGEYVAPERKSGGGMGTFVLSYPGVSFSFPVQHKAWLTNPGSVPMLLASDDSATSMAIYQGDSWAQARSTIFTAIPDQPRSLALSSKNKDAFADEIEMVRVLGSGRLEFVRRSSPTVQMVLNETTPQDLVAELGPPDAIFRKKDKHASIHATRAAKDKRQASMSPMMRPNTTESDQSSAHSYTEDSDEGLQAQADLEVNPECFYNYFHHGFDVFVSYPQAPSPPFPDSKPISSSSPATSGTHLVITKILLHANIPGSHSFNRHRRSRWTVTTPAPNGPLTSEMSFPELSSKLKTVWHPVYADPEQERAMQLGHVLNRGWFQTPESSIELLGDFEEQDFEDKKAGKTGQVAGDSMSNPELFGFPGLLFEVLKNDAVCCLTVY